MNTFPRSLALGTAIALSALTLAPWPSRAQSRDDAQTGVFPSNEPGNGFGGSSVSPFDLIHRATMGTLRDRQQFQRDAARNINNAAAEFRRQQLERLLQPQAQPTEGPAEAAPAGEALEPAAN